MDFTTSESTIYWPFSCCALSNFRTMLSQKSKNGPSTCDCSSKVAQVLSAKERWNTEMFKGYSEHVEDQWWEYFGGMGTCACIHIDPLRVCSQTMLMMLGCPAEKKSCRRCWRSMAASQRWRFTWPNATLRATSSLWGGGWYTELALSKQHNWTKTFG